MLCINLHHNKNHVYQGYNLDFVICVYENSDIRVTYMTYICLKCAVVYVLLYVLLETVWKIITGLKNQEFFNGHLSSAK